MLVFVFLALFGVVLIATCSDSCSGGSKRKLDPLSRRVTAEELGDRWPLTVTSGVIRCGRSGNALTFEFLGESYGVNGFALSRGYQPLDPIWARDPEIPGTRKSIRPLLDAAAALCPHAQQTHR